MPMFKVKVTFHCEADNGTQAADHVLHALSHGRTFAPIPSWSGAHVSIDSSPRRKALDELYERYPKHEHGEEHTVDGELCRYILVQQDSVNGQYWHLGAQEIQELIDYQAREDGCWQPVGVFDLDTGAEASMTANWSVGPFAGGGDA